MTESVEFGVITKWSGPGRFGYCFTSGRRVKIDFRNRRIPLLTKQGVFLLDGIPENDRSAYGRREIYDGREIAFILSDEIRVPAWCLKSDYDALMCVYNQIGMPIEFGIICSWNPEGGYGYVKVSERDTLFVGLGGRQAPEVTPEGVILRTIRERTYWVQTNYSGSEIALVRGFKLGDDRPFAQRWCFASQFDRVVDEYEAAIGLTADAESI